MQQVPRDETELLWDRILASRTTWNALDRDAPEVRTRGVGEKSNGRLTTTAGAKRRGPEITY